MMSISETVMMSSRYFLQNSNVSVPAVLTAQPSATVSAEASVTTLSASSAAFMQAAFSGSTPMTCLNPA